MQKTSNAVILHHLECPSSDARTEWRSRTSAKIQYYYSSHDKPSRSPRFLLLVAKLEEGRLAANRGRLLFHAAGASGGQGIMSWDGALDKGETVGRRQFWHLHTLASSCPIPKDNGTAQRGVLLEMSEESEIFGRFFAANRGCAAGITPAFSSKDNDWNFFVKYRKKGCPLHQCALILYMFLSDFVLEVDSSCPKMYQTIIAPCRCRSIHNVPKATKNRC